MPPPLPEPPTRTDRPLADRLGAVAGSLCAVHCVATIPLAGALSVGGLGSSLMSEEAERGFFAVAFGLVVFSVVTGYRHHRSPAILASFAACFGLWVGATLFAPEAAEPWLHALAGLGLAGTHLVSLRRLRAEHGCEDACDQPHARGV